MSKRQAPFWLIWFVLSVLGAVPAAAGVADPAGRLGYWRFNAADWRDEQGRLPLAVSNAISAASFDGNALRQTAAQGAGYVRFRAVGTNGAPLLSPRQGAIRFLYQPAWPGAAPIATTPAGQGRRLFEAGARDATGYRGQWMVSIDPTGTSLMVQTRTPQGTQVTNLQVHLDWTSSSGKSATGKDPGAQPNPWREIILNYTANTCTLIIDGAVQVDSVTKALTGPPLPLLSTEPAGEPAFSVGSSLAGEFPAEGLIDELETFDRPISPLRSYTYLCRAGPSVEVLPTTPPAVQLSWFTTGNDVRTLRRLEFGTGGNLVLGEGLSGMSFTDTNGLRPGGLYLYILNDRGRMVAINRAPVDNRGRVIVLVDQTLAATLRSELEQFQLDLVGDGWTVLRHDVPRHLESPWNGGSVDPAYRADLERIKALITTDYRVAPDQTAAVVLIGHVTIPYSGIGAEDGHPDHLGAWPADSFYGDMEGEWTDTSAETPAAVTHPLLQNRPGDGKFDSLTFPWPARLDGPRRAPGLDMAVGRIDFAKLPAFAPKSEADLLRQYFDKNHRYRQKRMTFQQSVLVGAYFGNPYHDESVPLYDTANLLAASLYGPVLSTVVDGNAFAAQPSAVWAIQGGYGDPTALHNSVDMNNGLGLRRVSATELAQANPEPQVGFYVLKGSYFGDWNFTDNNFLRAVLATPNYGLAALWTRNTVWAVDRAGTGDPIASPVLATASGTTSVRTTSMQGDPTLRLFVTTPPTDLRAARAGTGVELKWTASPDAADGYLVYRSTNGLLGEFARVSPGPITGATFTDALAPANGRLGYQVRACQLLLTGSGSFTNTSQAAMVEVAPGR